MNKFSRVELFSFYQWLCTNVVDSRCIFSSSSAALKIITKTRQIVDVKKDDGFAALHLAALNGHKEVAQHLIITVSICMHSDTLKREIRTGIVQVYKKIQWAQPKSCCIGLLISYQFHWAKPKSFWAPELTSVSIPAYARQISQEAAIGKCSSWGHDYHVPA